MQAAAPSTDEVKPLLADDSLAPDTKPAPTTGPTSVAEQLDAMKGSGPTLQTSQPPEPPLDLFKGKELESAPAATSKSKSSDIDKVSGVEVGQEELQKPIDASVPGTEIAPNHPGDTSFTQNEDAASVSASITDQDEVLSLCLSRGVKFSQLFLQHDSY